MKKIFSLGCFLLTATWLSAQVYVRHENLTTQGVNNDGLSVGYYTTNGTYYLWDATTQDMTEIGGISAGNGFGGMTKFSEDGKYICGEFMTDYMFPQDWRKSTLYGLGYRIKGMTQNTVSNTIFAIASYQDAGDVLINTSNFDTWTVYYKLFDKPLTAIYRLSPYVVIITGADGFCNYTTNDGSSWKTLDPTGTKAEVRNYTAINFVTSDPYPGMIGAEMPDGTGMLYMSPDGGETWTPESNLPAVPVCIGHEGNNFFVGTADGKVLKITFTDGGWSAPAEVYGGGKGFHAMTFNGATGIITADNGMIYMTEDGGENWEARKISVDENDALRDAAWNGGTLTVVGDRNSVYTSTDNGKTWIAESGGTDFTGDLLTVTGNQEKTVIAGDEMFCRMDKEKEYVGVMGRYDVEAGKWQDLGSLGYIGDGPDMSSAYAISGDGKTVAGLAETIIIKEMSASGKTIKYPTRSSHAIAWVEDGNKIIDLGDRYENIARMSYTRADAVNADGSVIVGIQINKEGQRIAAVWYRNEDGTYAENIPVLIDPNAEEDFYNTARDGRAVSPNGQWVGGGGKQIASGGPLTTAASTPILEEDAKIQNQPWLWNKTEGFRRIGEISEYAGDGAAEGYVTGINDEGTFAVGFFLKGSEMKAFVWTKEHGMMSANDYLATVKGFQMDGIDISSILDLSPNGRYAAAWGFNEIEGTTLIEKVAFLIDFSGNGPSGIEGVSKNATTVRQTGGSLHITLPGDTEAVVTICDMQGHVMMKERTHAATNDYDISNYAQGIYLLSIDMNGRREMHKVLIQH